MTFPGIIERKAGGPPPMPAGQRILHYLAPDAAQLELPNGKRAIIESTQPMATETSPGHLAPVELGLIATGNVFESARPVVGAIVPKHLSAGLELPETGVSLTPVDSNGGPLEAQGSLVGATVLYPNTQTDTDTIAKPTTLGFETNTILRSIASPTQLQFRVGLPSGARLLQAPGESSARVVLDGQTIAIVRAPSARDAEGTPVPLSMSAVGDLLTLMVSAKDGEYQWPITVDPELVEVDRGMGPKECRKPGESGPSTSNWCWFSNAEANFQHEWNANLNGRGLGIAIKKPFGGSLSAGNYAGVGYHTQGTSKIFKLETETEGSNFKRSEARLELAQKRGTEAGSVEAASTIERAGAGSTGWQNRWTTVTSAGTPENVAAIKVEALETNVETNIEAGVYQANVYIEQETSPEVTFNESEGTIDSGRSNVLYPSSSGAEWLSPTQGAFELKGKDKGLGVKEANVTIGSFHQTFPVAAEGKCNGAQCPEELQPSFMTYNPSMPEGEPTIEWAAENWADWQECNAHFPACPNGKITRHIKIDAKKPSKLEVTGWPASREISAAPHTITVAATDEAPSSETHSSGIKSVTVSIDGATASTVSGATCTLGTCTASGQYKINAESLTEGVHRLVETATDNAGNVGATEFTFDVRHANPVSVGPGAVDPTTGQFTLSATDASLAGVGAVTRTYQSRNLAAGAEGPLGSQWALSTGGGEGITVLPTGSVVLAGPNGGGRPSCARRAANSNRRPATAT